jgi:hypothetical protein
MRMRNEGFLRPVSRQGARGNEKPALVAKEEGQEHVFRGEPARNLAKRAGIPVQSTEN